MLSGLIVIFSSQTLLTIEEDNIIIYIVEYISCQITKLVCSKCVAGLIGLLNKANPSYVFTDAKQTWGQFHFVNSNSIWSIPNEIYQFQIYQFQIYQFQIYQFQFRFVPTLFCLILFTRHRYSEYLLGIPTPSNLYF